MSNYTAAYLTKLRLMYSQDEIIRYFDVNEEEKEYLKKLEKVLDYLADNYSIYTGPLDDYFYGDEMFYALSHLTAVELHSSTTSVYPVAHDIVSGRRFGE